MKHRAIALAILCVACVAALAAPATQTALNRLLFPKAGFSIACLDDSAKQGGKVLTMLLPASDGFAPNVNVLTQPYPGTLVAYEELSKKQFEQAKFTLVSEKKNGNSLVFEVSVRSTPSGEQ